MDVKIVNLGVKMVAMTMLIATTLIYCHLFGYTTDE
jgi:hypothetical protein